MHPADFVVWLKGAYDIIGDRDPTPLERQCIQERLHDALANIARDKILGVGAPDAVAMRQAATMPPPNVHRMPTPRERLLRDLEDYKKASDSVAPPAVKY